MTDTTHPVAVAGGLGGRARMQALAAAQADPDSTWIDAFAAIDQCLSQLTIAADGALFTASPESNQTDEPSCLVLLEPAERALAGVQPGTGPASLVLVRAYLTEAILETAGREP
ncbi:MAG: hypothetical protein WCG47_26040 [Dermatophilaceae bacterium]